MKHFLLLLLFTSVVLVTNTASATYCPEASSLQPINTGDPFYVFFQGIINNKIARSKPIDIRPYLNTKGQKNYTITFQNELELNVSCNYQIKNNTSETSENFVVSNKVTIVALLTSNFENKFSELFPNLIFC